MRGKEDWNAISHMANKKPAKNYRLNFYIMFLKVTRSFFLSFLGQHRASFVMGISARSQGSRKLSLCPSWF